MARPGMAGRKRRRKQNAKARAEAEARKATQVTEQALAAQISGAELPAAETPSLAAGQHRTKAPSLPAVQNTAKALSSKTVQGTAATSPLRAAQNTGKSPSLSAAQRTAATSPLVTVQNASEIPSLSTSQISLKDLAPRPSPFPLRRAFDEHLSIMDSTRPGVGDGAVPLDTAANYTKTVDALAAPSITSNNSDLSQDTVVESTRSNSSGKHEISLYEPGFRPKADKMGSSSLLVKYTREPPPDVKLHTFWLRLPQHNIDFTDAEIAHAMNLISMDCKAWINTSKVPTLEQIQIRVVDKMQFVRTRMKIIEYLCRDNQEEPPSWHPFTLVQHPADGKGYEAAIIQIEPGKGRFAFKKLDEPLVGDLDEFAASLAMEFQVVFNKITREMKSEMSDMLMRVHMGNVEMKRWKRRDVMTYDEYDELARKAGKLGFSEFDQNIGDAEFGRMIRDKIYASADKFSPPISTISRLEDIVPRHYAVLFVEGGKRLEIEIQKDGQSAKTLGMKAYGRPLHEITAVCPGHYYDWKLDVQHETPIKNLRPGLSALRKKITFGSSTSKDEFPTPMLSFDDIRTAGIGSIAAKTVWTFECMDSKYYLEYCIYREWNNSVATVRTVDQEPKVTCGVTFYGAGWDDEMRAQNTVITPRNFGEKQKKLLETGHEAFIADVGKIKHFVEEARAFFDGGKGIEVMPLPVRPPQEEVEKAKFREAKRREEAERRKEDEQQKAANRQQTEGSVQSQQTKASTKARNAEFAAMTPDEQARHVQNLKDRAIRRSKLQGYLDLYEKKNEVELDREKVLKRVEQLETDETEFELEQVILQHVVKPKPEPVSIDDLLGGPSIEGEVLLPTAVDDLLGGPSIGGEVLKPLQKGGFHQKTLDDHSVTIAAAFDCTLQATKPDTTKPKEKESKKKAEDQKSDGESSVDLIEF